MRTLRTIIYALFLLLAGAALPVNAAPVAVDAFMESEGDSVWKMDEALLVNSSQITAKGHL